MLSKQQAKDLVRDSIIAINEEKEEGQKIPVSDDTILLGSGTLLDSLNIVVLITDIEERLHALTGRELQITEDMMSFEGDNPFRTVATLSEHIATILQSE